MLFNFVGKLVLGSSLRGVTAKYEAERNIELSDVAIQKSNWIASLFGGLFFEGKNNPYSRLAMTAVVAVFLVLPMSANAKEKGIITVTGEAKMDVVPDVVDVSLVVEISDKNLNIAQRKNDEIVANVLKIAKALDVPDRNVQTNYINVRPVYEQINGKMVFTRFETVKGIAVKLTDISKLQELLEKTAEAGVNRVDGVNFTSSKFERLQNDVQVMAAKNAKMRADTIAASLGAKVDKPYRITVNSSYQSPSPHGEVMMMKAASMADRTIAAGQVTITANVNVDFELD